MSVVKPRLHNGIDLVKCLRDSTSALSGNQEFIAHQSSQTTQVKGLLIDRDVRVASVSNANPQSLVGCVVPPSALS